MYRTSSWQTRVAALDELDAHLPREERVLEVRRVVDARREQHDRRARRSGRRGRAQRREQLLRVVVDRADAAPLEQVGERPLHRLPVLEHVARARRRAEVVLEHEVLAALVADHVNPGHVRVHAAGRVDPDHLAAEMPRAEHERGRHAALEQDALLVVDVVEEALERRDPLREPALEERPLVRRDHARDQVEREDPLELVLCAVDGEADPGVAERGLDRPAALAELVGRELGELAREGGVVRPRRAAGVEHLVEERAGLVALAEERGLGTGNGQGKAGHRLSKRKRGGLAPGAPAGARPRTQCARRANAETRCSRNGDRAAIGRP
jgi:hypothetical protein